MPTLLDRVVLYRFLLVFTVFGAPAVMVLMANEWSISIPFLGLLFPLVAGILLCVVYLLLLVRFPELRLNKVFLAIQYVLDAVVIMIPIAFTDGTSSAYIMLLVLLIVVAAITHSTRFAVTMALLSCVIVTAMSYLEVNGMLPGMTAPPRSEIIPRILVRDFIYFGLFMLVGVLPGGVAARVQRTDRALDYVRRDYAIIRELYRLMVERVPSGISLIDDDDRVILLNSAGRAILRSLGMGGDGPALRTILAGNEAQGEAEVETPEGARVIGFGVAELNPDTTMRGRLVIFQDVTERKRLEASLEEQKRLGALGHMAAQLAHELRNPLAGISNSLQLLAGSVDAESKEGRLFSIQEREIRRLERLVADFLQYAKPDDPQAGRIMLAPQLREIVERTQMQPEAEGVRIEVDCPADLFLVTDPDLLGRVLGNLVLNAVQWCQGDGRVVVAAALAGDRVEIRVVDDGPGIQPEDREHLFEPFYSRRCGGTGLGLAIAWSATAGMGGELTLESTRPGRTVFLVRLPQTVPATGAGGEEVLNHG